MKVQELIESGLIELYALDQCSPQEAILVEEHLDNPSVEAEYQAIQESLLAVAESHAKKPSADLKSRIFAELATKEPLAEKEAEPKVIALNPAKKNKYKVWLRAAMIALVVSVGANGIFFMDLSQAKSEIAQLRTSNLVLASEINISRTNYEDVKSVTNFFAEGEIKTVKLNSTSAKEQKAVVFWDEKSGQALLNAKDLPAIASDKSYQLWCLIDGKPVDMGVVPTEMVGNGELAMLKKSTVKPDAFAITIEPLGGQESPTLDQLMVLGNLQS